MTYKINGEQPFQVLASNFSIGPSNEGYTLQISADGINYSDLFSVGAGVTRMVTGVANGSYYKLSGNESEVAVNWTKQCSDGQGGGGEGTGPQGPIGPVGPQGPQGPAGSGEGGGDSHILKSGSAMPSGASVGDVYSTYSDAEDAQYGEDWTDTGNMTLYWNRDYDGNQPQAIRIEVPQGTVMMDIFTLRYACNAYDNAVWVNIDENGYLSLPTGQFRKVSDNHWVLSESAWVPSKTNGNVIYIDFDGTYVYAYSTDVEKVWVFGVENNYINQNVYTGEVTPPMDARYDVYQAVAVAKEMMTVTGVGDYNDDRTTDGQFVLHNGASMNVAVDAEYFSTSGGTYTPFVLESWGMFGKFEFDANTWSWKLYDYESDVDVIATITDGQVAQTFQTSDGNDFQWSWNDDVLTITLLIGDKGFQKFNIPSVEQLDGEKLAKLSDLPDDSRLFPTSADDGAMPIYSTYANKWITTQRDAVFIDGMYAFQNNWQDDGRHYTLTRDGYWGVNWTPSFRMVKLTQTEYDALAQGDGYDSNTLYIIIPDTNQGA